jgi:hypothetical protein
LKQLLLLIFTTLTLGTEAQVLCIKCYDQNVRVLTNTNNLIVNGGFEISTCPPDNGGDTSFCPNSLYYHCDIANWICTGGGDSTYAHICDSSFSLIIEGTQAAYFGNALCYVCSPSWYNISCLNYVDCGVTGIPIGYPYNTVGYGGVTGVSLQQTVNGLTAGAVYVLEFWAGGEIAVADGIFAVDVGFGNILLTDPVTRFISDIGTRYLIVFSATSSSHIIRFTNWGHINAGWSTELVLDDVRLFQVDEATDPCLTTISNTSTPSSLNVFPNPCTDKLNIFIKGNDQNEIMLYDILSRKIMQKKFTNSATLNTEQLSRGIYIYEVRNKNGVIQKGEVVKE